jgi:hypothetical protein
VTALGSPAADRCDKASEAAALAGKTFCRPPAVQLPVSRQCCAVASSKAAGGTGIGFMDGDEINRGTVHRLCANRQTAQPRAAIATVAGSRRRAGQLWVFVAPRMLIAAKQNCMPTSA